MPYTRPTTDVAKEGLFNIIENNLDISELKTLDLFGGTDYGMRIWFRPDMMAKLGLVPADVINAIKEQNVQSPAGKIGGSPTPKDQEMTQTLSAPGRLVTPEEFENVIVRQTATQAIGSIADAFDARGTSGPLKNSSAWTRRLRPFGSCAVGRRR